VKSGSRFLGRSGCCVGAWSHVLLVPVRDPERGGDLDNESFVVHGALCHREFILL
jgi:hypothetical protein